MRIGKLSVGLAALALVAAPAIAQGSIAPAITPLSGDEAAASEGGAGGIILGGLAVAAVIAAVVVASDGNDTQLPVSP